MPPKKAANKRVLPPWEDLWAAWSALSEEEKKAAGSDAGIDAKLEGLDVATMPSRHEPESESTQMLIPKSKASLKDRADLNIKLDIYKDLVNLFAESQDAKEDRFEKLLKELKGVGMRAFDIGKRFERANEGKEAANKKYKDGNWFGAMYTYAIAWGCLVPFYPGALPESDQLRKDIEKLELALFSNISAMAVSGADDKTIKTPKPINKAKLLHIGLRASVYCLSHANETTLGIVTKSCRRAQDLSAKLTSAHKIKPAPAASLALWKAQEDALAGLAAAKTYAEQPADKKLLTKSQKAGEADWRVLQGFEVYSK